MGELPEVWCANDDRPAVVFVPTSRGGAEPEKRALCADCWWKAQSAAKVEKPKATR